MKKLLSLPLATIYLLLSTATAHADPWWADPTGTTGTSGIDLGNITGSGQFQTGNVNSQLGNFLSTVINTITVMAGLAFILYFAIGGLKWITSSGDKSRAEEAKTELTQSAIGLIVVAVSYFIVGIVGGVVGINILNPCKLLDPTGILGVCK